MGGVTALTKIQTPLEVCVLVQVPTLAGCGRRDGRMDRRRVGTVSFVYLTLHGTQKKKVQRLKVR